MTSRTTVVIAWLTAAASAGLAGCATDGSPSKPPARPSAAAPSSVMLSSTNGDMSRYRGTWTSICGREYRLNAAGQPALTSGTNAFRLTSVSGNSVKGTLVVDTYESRDCTGPSRQSSADITLTYSQNIPATTSYGELTRYTGSADKVTAIQAGADGADATNTFNVGFLDNFTKFQLAPLDSFSSTNLVYSKK